MSSPRRLWWSFLWAFRWSVRWLMRCVSRAICTSGDPVSVSWSRYSAIVAPLAWSILSDMTSLVVGGATGAPVGLEPCLTARRAWPEAAEPRIGVGAGYQRVLLRAP